MDVWAMRDADLLHRRDDSVRVAWIHAALAHVVEAERPVALAELEAVLRMQRSALAMYTSCGWFFSDIAGIEARILLRHASLVCDSLAALRGDASATDEFCRALAETRSHRAGFATGEDVYRAVSSRREPVLE